jgi:pterin-4a-carbinolamine dehydratase
LVASQPFRPALDGHSSCDPGDALRARLAEIAAGVARDPRVTRAGEAIRKQFTFASFADAVTFLVRLAFDAEAADHHPDVTVTAAASR